MSLNLDKMPSGGPASIIFRNSSGSPTDMNCARDGGRDKATYVALSRPQSLAQLISVGLPDDLREIIEAGPPQGILTRFNDMFEEKEKATHIRAAEVMRELGWDATE